MPDKIEFALRVESTAGERRLAFARLRVSP